MMTAVGLLVDEAEEGIRLLRTGATREELEELSGQYATRRGRDRDRLDQMIIYAQTALCRWNALLKYFGQAQNRLRSAADLSMPYARTVATLAAMYQPTRIVLRNLPVCKSGNLPIYQFNAFLIFSFHWSCARALVPWAVSRS